MIAAAAVLSVLAALAVVKTFEQRIPPVAVRIGLLVFVLGPLAALVYAMWALWQWALQPIDLLLLVVFAVVTGLGTSLGYHRLLTHRSFQTTPWITGMALAAGAMAVPSRPIDWAARHLEHHAHADREGDPHSPLDGLLHAHVGWMFGVSAAKRERYCRRLMRDPVVMFIERTALVWLALGLAVPALIDGWRGLLWGGIVRMAIHNHAMFGVNSICHAFGSQPFATGDESRNNRLIAVLAFGEGWHNNHHAFPAMAYHGMGSRPDATGLVIRGLERAGLAWDVNRPDPAAVARRRTLEITGSTRPQPRRSHASASLAPAATPASARRPRSPSARTETVPGRRFRCSGWCRWCRNPARTVRRRLRRTGARPG